MREVLSQQIGCHPKENLLWGNPPYVDTQDSAYVNRGNSPLFVENKKPADESHAGRPLGYYCCGFSSRDTSGSVNCYIERHATAHIGHIAERHNLA